MKQEGTPIYPTLPETAPSAPPDHTFRLQEITRLKSSLECERDQRASLYKKYRRGVNALDGIDTALITASTGMGIAGVGLLSTIVAAPIVLGLEIAALACGVLGTSGKFISRRLAVKAMKHNQIMTLANSKINSIADHVSTALVDGHISDNEFRLILDEVTKYNQMKSEIRAGSRKAHAGIILDEKIKQSLIQQGRDEAQESIRKHLSGVQ